MLEIGSYFEKQALVNMPGLCMVEEHLKTASFGLWSRSLVTPAFWWRVVPRNGDQRLQFREHRILPDTAAATAACNQL